MSSAANCHELTYDLLIKTRQRLELSTLEKNLCSCSWIVCTCTDRCPGKCMGIPIMRAVWRTCLCTAFSQTAIARVVVDVVTRDPSGRRELRKKKPEEKGQSISGTGAGARDQVTSTRLKIVSYNMRLVMM
uniref:Uncharacterized protein n=1 Tax=Trichogramma kaykai TaxID=54128 RepID=A0ABD2XCW2_9HYME